jgi:hypothetical protein
VIGTMTKQRASSSTHDREGRLRQARRRGFADGVASVLCASATGPRPAPVRLRRSDGSLAEDWQALQRDGVPGLAREIVDQWKAETYHRHETVTSMRTTDHEEMVIYYAAERRGQTFSILAILGVLAIALVAIAYDRPVVGVTGLLTGSAAAIWAMRRRSTGPDVTAPAGSGPSRLGPAAERAGEG